MSSRSFVASMSGNRAGDGIHAHAAEREPSLMSGALSRSCQPTYMVD